MGKPEAPLDVYLDVVCPIIGLISAKEYFEAFNWVWNRTQAGAAKLEQNSEPDLRKFEHRIIHTTMTEMDIIKYCGSIGYLPLPVAMQISTGLNPGHAQQGLLASAPSLPPRPNVQTFFTPPESHYDWTCQIEWTGNLSDLYSPNELDPNLIQDTNLWNSQDHQSLGNFLGEDGRREFFDPFGMCILLL